MKDAPTAGEPKVNPDSLEPTIDISLALQKKILILYAKTGSSTYYELLGLARDAEKKEIKRAYFALINVFHEDKFFGKDIGNFGPRLRKIVEELTAASDALTRNRSRQEYDAALNLRLGPLVPSQDSSRASLEETPVIKDECPASPQIPPAPRVPILFEKDEAEGTNRDPGSEELQIDSASPSSGKSPIGEDASTKKVPSAASRRLLARKMRGLSRPPPSHQVNQEILRAAVARDLRSRYDAKRNAGRNQVQAHIKMAATAEAEGDWTSAVNALKIASQLAPDDAELQAKLGELQQQADIAQAPMFLEQGKREERDARYEHAAKSFERAARGKNSSELFQRAATCLEKAAESGPLSSENLRNFVELARQAVHLDKARVTYRLTLARAYSTAGMTSSALGEIGRALGLEPDNEDAKQLQKSLK